MSFEQPANCEELLNYRIARLLSVSGALVIRLCEGRYGISRREWRLIAMLADYGTLAPSELAERAHTDRPLVSRAISDLVAKGLVSRVGRSSDRHRVAIELTDKGRALHAELFPITADINGRILQALGPERIRELDDMLNVLTRTAEQINQDYPLKEKADRRNGGSRQWTSSKPDLAGVW
ncbi:MarR family transcriptional regulator [Pigmentiphaga sp. H8]|uniref:DNA-binding MarR family transcriptional regulator n=1 Tax=Pigmentiphaga kullae TaxID=151784 RepID=A0A4Q7NA18_9BURK|nr:MULTISPECIES: MarR family winged helix-turn-helix transcriptional regulator [Pigmentiphaga]AZG09345.1 MarR family transcriptional regulator [Pigmentiphaga sp. H8]RZS78970.1 DNA-binding MarR family transcriptional regulator [Pigmentiphaga kullae]